MKPKLISQGAEAKLFLEKEIVTKARIPKTYRLKELDEKIRKGRTKREAKILEKAQKIINVPKFLHKTDFEIEMEFIDGDRLSEKLNSYKIDKQFKVMEQIGNEVSKLHKENIIHGDLTTSNTILKGEKVYIIDFGLGFISHRIEDKAVDLHLIRQALEAKHFQNWEKLFEFFKKGYKKDYQDSEKILLQFKKVESRGRYKKNF